MLTDTAADTDILFDDQTPESITRSLETEFPRMTVIGRLKRLAQTVSGRLVHTSSFGIEGQVLTHLIVEAGIDVEFVTLDTGRLFPETYDVWVATEARYGIRIKPFYPDASSLRALVTAHGINGLLESVEARQACCAVRKLRQLDQALSGASVWLTGLRADQSAYRSAMHFVSYDAHRRLIKANPLFDWARDVVMDFVTEHAIPINALHARGFVSIGCAPCTRAIDPGEPERAGRWWWEDKGSRECGLHVAPDGRLVRQKPR